MRRLELVVLIRPGQCQDSPLAAAADGASPPPSRMYIVIRMYIGVPGLPSSSRRRLRPLASYTICPYLS